MGINGFFSFVGKAVLDTAIKDISESAKEQREATEKEQTHKENLDGSIDVEFKVIEQ